jgi:hypothetical protein
MPGSVASGTPCSILHGKVEQNIASDLEGTQCYKRKKENDITNSLTEIISEILDFIILA